jgi:hypothetical protein
MTCESWLGYVVRVVMPVVYSFRSRTFFDALLSLWMLPFQIAYFHKPGFLHDIATIPVLNRTNLCSGHKAGKTRLVVGSSFIQLSPSMIRRETYA